MYANKQQQQKQKIKGLWERMQSNKNSEINKVHYFISILLLKLLTRVYWKKMFWQEIVKLKTK